MPDSPQAVRHCSIKNNLSAVYAQSNAARILNRPALPLPRSGAAGQVPACRQRAGRSAGPEVGRDVPTPPSLPLDSTHPATGKGLLAPFRPQRGSRAGKNLAASLNDFFSVLHLYLLSRYATAPPGGASAAAAVSRYDPPVKMGYRKVRRLSCNPKFKIILPLNMPSNDDDRRQWRKQGGVVGAAASKTRVPPKARSGCWVPQPVSSGGHFKSIVRGNPKVYEPLRRI